MGVDRRSQLTTTRRKGREDGGALCWGTEIESICRRGGFLRRRETFNPYWAGRLQKMGAGVDGWVGVQNMTGHPGYYLYPAIPSGAKTERLDKDEKR